MKADLDSLLAVAELDVEIDEQETLRKEGEREIQRLSLAVDAARKAESELDTAIKENQSQQRLLELDLQANQVQIKKITDYNSNARSNEEYRQNLKHIDELKVAASEHEDRILVLMEAREELDERKAVAAAAVQKAGEKHVQREKEIRARIEAGAKKAATLQEQRNVLAKDIDPDPLTAYERIRELRGKGIARLQDNNCQGCFVTLTLNTANLVLIKQVVHCPSCGRVLYMDKR